MPEKPEPIEMAKASRFLLLPSPEYDAVRKSIVEGTKLKLDFPTVDVEWLEVKPLTPEDILAVINAICHYEVLAAFGLKYPEGTMTSTDFNDVSESSLTTSNFPITKLFAFEHVTCYYVESDNINHNLSLPSLDNGKYSLCIIGLECASLNLSYVTNCNHRSLLYTQLYNDNSPIEKFPALALGRIQYQGKTTNWVVVVRIPNGDLYTMRSEGHLALELYPERSAIVASELPEFDAKELKAVKLSSIFSSDYSASAYQVLDITRWDTAEVPIEDILTDEQIKDRLDRHNKD